MSSGWCGPCGACAQICQHPVSSAQTLRTVARGNMGEDVKVNLESENLDRGNLGMSLVIIYNTESR